MKTKYISILILISILFDINLCKIEVHASQTLKQVNSDNNTREMEAIDLIKSSSKIIVDDIVAPEDANVLLLDTKRRNVISTPKEDANEYYSNFVEIGYELNGIPFIYSNSETYLKQTVYFPTNIIMILCVIISCLLIGYTLNQDNIKEIFE